MKINYEPRIIVEASLKIKPNMVIIKYIYLYIFDSSSNLPKSFQNGIQVSDSSYNAPFF